MILFLSDFHLVCCLHLYIVCQFFS